MAKHIIKPSTGTVSSGDRSCKRNSTSLPCFLKDFDRATDGAVVCDIFTGNFLHRVATGNRGYSHASFYVLRIVRPIIGLWFCNR